MQLRDQDLAQQRHSLLPLPAPALLARAVEDAVGDDVGLQLHEQDLAQQRQNLLPLPAPALLAHAVHRDV
eukprot:5315671-Pyramimonas_sp.AAC.1